MADLRDRLVDAAGSYLAHLATARDSDTGRFLEEEDTLWVTLVRARNAYLAAQDEETLR